PARPPRLPSFPTRRSSDLEHVMATKLKIYTAGYATVADAVHVALGLRAHVRQATPYIVARSKASAVDLLHERGVRAHLGEIRVRSEEHTSELSHDQTSYAV